MTAQHRKMCTSTSQARFKPQSQFSSGPRHMCLRLCSHWDRLSSRV